jgi:transglutaminase-like putative cysteine protease
MKFIKKENIQANLQPTYFIDGDSPQVIGFADKITKGVESDIEKAIKLFYAVRDEIYYDPYGIDPNPESLRASAVLHKRSGFCVTKAILLAAAARVVKIPSRLGFADVRNHLSSGRLRQLMQTDIFVFHGYTELFLENRWVKATPAFNLSLCDKAGKQHMEYLRDRGQFSDFPYKLMFETWKQYYPQFFPESSEAIGGNFEEEVSAERKG